MGSFLHDSIDQIRRQVGKDHVLCALSGGVDSTVAAAMTHRAIGKQLTCVFIDNGVMRKQEARQLKEAFKSFHFNCRMIDASEHFLRALGGTTDPEKNARSSGVNSSRRSSAKRETSATCDTWSKAHSTPT